MLSLRFVTFLSLLTAPALWAGEASPPVAQAVRTTTPPKIDGKLDDAEWQAAPVINSFTQRDPREGAPASHPTSVRVLYDNEAIYVAARIENSEPILFRLGRRDMTLASSDWFQVSLDTFRDRRNAVRFAVNPGGVKRDSTITGDYFGGGTVNAFTGVDGELAWDAVWDVSTSIDPAGWNAEFKIPFSQLRFAKSKASATQGEAGEDIGKGGEQVWGVQFETINARRQELAMFAFTPKAQMGGVAAFGNLEGLRITDSNKSLELVPYVLGQGTFDATSANRLNKTAEYDFKAGLDARYRITSNLTLTTAINPDFGQVEVDPAVINLTAFETKLEEKRPFFVEGSGYFKIAPSLRSFYAAREMLYTRRIGRAPQIKLPSDTRQTPATTDIVAAAKLTGRTEGGWTVGVLDAYTKEMTGVYLDGTGARRTGVVEPATNYLLGRISREMRNGDTAIGLLGSAVNRDLGDPLAAATLAKSAYTGSVDLGHDFFKRVWNISAYVAGTRVTGTPSAITALQRSSSRYYQRPDASVTRLDPKATSLSGSSGQFQFGKRTGKHWDGNLAYLYVSPGYEINDIGFNQRVDRRGFSGRITYTDRALGKYLRNSVTNFYYAYFQNYDGDWLDKNLRIYSVLQNRQFWSFEIDAERMADRFDDRLTRGGPVAAKAASNNLILKLSTDARKQTLGSVSAYTKQEASGSRIDGISAAVELRAPKRWSLQMGPRLDSTQQVAQYVTSVADARATGTYGRRYIFAPLKQTEAALETRLNYAFSANLTLELYTQALVANGNYGAPKEFLTPRGFRFATYGVDQGTISKTGSKYTIDPDGAGPAGSFKVDDLSFTSRSLRANAVLRWEFRPGSTLYAVWQQERLNPLLMENFTLSRSTTSVFDPKPRNVFALKMSYWFNL
jgi:hypothetical protein